MQSRPRGAFKARCRARCLSSSLFRLPGRDGMGNIKSRARAIGNRNKRKQILVLHSPCAHKRKLFIAAYWEINMRLLCLSVSVSVCVYLLCWVRSSISDAAGAGPRRGLMEKTNYFPATDRQTERKRVVAV
jgi:hypothetical protein